MRYFFQFAKQPYNNYRKEEDCRKEKDNEPYYCSHCDKLFTSSKSLKRHIENHSGEKRFGCPFCGSSYSTTSIWKVHVRIHTGEKPFSCLDCSKSFSTAGNLRLHRRVHTKEKPYLCTECGKSFGQVSAMKMLLRVHTKEKPFLCTECGKSFAQVSAMKMHLRVHTGEKPHKCFPVQRHLQHLPTWINIIKLFTADKSHSCVLCVLNVYQMWALLRNEPDWCSTCKKSFALEETWIGVRKIIRTVKKFTVYDHLWYIIVCDSQLPTGTILNSTYVKHKEHNRTVVANNVIIII